MIWAVIGCGAVLAAGSVAVGVILWRGLADIAAAIRGTPGGRERATAGTARVYSPWARKKRDEEGSDGGR